MSNQTASPFGANADVPVSVGTPETPSDNMRAEHDILELINELSQVQDEMLQFFVRKRQAMADRDTSGQEQFSAEEQSLNQRLLDCYNRRSELLERESTPSAKSESLSELTDQLPQSRRGRLKAEIRASEQRTNQVRMEALATWVVAQRNLLDCSQKLEIIATGGQGRATYGQEDSAILRGNLVNEEA